MHSIQITDVLQICCLNGLTGVAEIRGSTVKGRVYLNEGKIVHATAGELSGEEALYVLLNDPRNEFEFREERHHAVRTIDKEWEFLLLEAARIRDTEREGAGKVQEGPATRLVLTIRRIPLARSFPPSRMVRINLTGTIETPGKKNEECMIDGLGLSGCVIRTLEPFHRGDRFLVRFRLDPAAGEIRARSEVVAVDEDTLTLRVRFLEMAESMKRSLERFLAKS